MLFPTIMLGVVVALVIFFKSPVFKGWVGEKSVQLVVSIGLDKTVYHGIQNVTISDGHGTTQIDHVYISRYGIFVLETKNYKGWIFGSPNDRNWTQKLFKNSYRFQNPLWQNKKHIRCLSQLLELAEDKFHSVIVFCPDAEFKTQMPDNVVYSGKPLCHYIKSFQNVLFDDQQVLAIRDNILLKRYEPNGKTHKQHVRYLKEKHSKAESMK